MVNIVDGTPDFYSIKQASLILGVSPKTVQLWVENGNLRAWKTAGGHRRIIRDSVDEVLQQRQGGSRSPRSASTVQSKVEQNLTPRVLIVEDEDVLRRLYAYNINQWSDSIQIDMASDGFEALVKIGRGRPDVLITDLSMPGMDGFRMLRRLYELEELSSMLVIVVTSYDADAVKGLGVLLDHVHVFEKPAPFKTIKALAQKKLLQVQGQLETR